MLNQLNNVKQNIKNVKQLYGDVRELTSRLGPINIDRSKLGNYYDSAKQFLAAHNDNNINEMADIASKYIPSDPKQIIEGAKGLDAFKSKYAPRAAPVDWIDKTNYFLEDVGAGAGVGMTAAGAAIKNATANTRFHGTGQKIRDSLTKRGIKTVLDADTAKGTAGLALAAGSLPILGAGVYATNKTLDYMGNKSLEKKYGMNPKYATMDTY